MSLFKVLRGSEIHLPTQKTDGWAYFCTDTGSFWIDHLDSNNTLVRSKISANFADKLRYVKDGETVELDPSEIATHTYVETQLGNALLNSQADWNENDETSHSYIKNRTHYECTEMVAIVPEQSLEFISGNPEYIYDVENLVAGETYTVFFNGTEYICVAYTTGYQDEIAIGNGALVDLNRGNSEPFFAAVFDGEMIVFAEEGTHTLSVKKSVESIVTIDEKFIPDSIKIGRMGTAIGAEIFNDYANNEASDKYAHAEGYNTTASARYAHAEGENTEASGYSSHAEGLNTVAMGNWSHAEGDSTTSSGSTSHAEGVDTTASGDYSHAEGAYTVASGLMSHAEGQGSVATARWSHAEGNNTTASALGQHVQGEYNILDTEGSIYERGRYAHIVGNGTYEARSNAHTLDWSGNAWFAGDIYVGGTSQDDASRLVKFDELPDGVAIDATLTQKDHAADAKATGDVISQMQADTQIYVDNQIAAAKSYTDTKVAELVNSAPDTLDTLNELADALGDDPNFATTMATELGKKATKEELLDVKEDLQANIDGKADSSHNHDDKYCAKTEIDNLELITVDDIDTICGSTISYANSEVTF